MPTKEVLAKNNENFSLACRFFRVAYEQGYSGQPLEVPEASQKVIDAWLEYRHMLGAHHKERGKQSEYFNPYGLPKTC